MEIHNFSVTFSVISRAHINISHIVKNCAVWKANFYPIFFIGPGKQKKTRIKRGLISTLFRFTLKFKFLLLLLCSSNSFYSFSSSSSFSFCLSSPSSSFTPLPLAFYCFLNICLYWMQVAGWLCTFCSHAHQNLYTPNHKP